MNPDLIIASYAGAAVAAKRTTSTIPIVMIGGTPSVLVWWPTFRNPAEI